MGKIKKILALAAASVTAFFVLSSTSVQADEDVERIYGENRYETAVKISKAGWEGGSDVVFIARGNDFPDALSGTPLAHKYNAPILLSRTAGLSGETLNEIERLQAGQAVILGGENAVSPDVEETLLALGLTVDRIGGENRYETSVLIANELSQADDAFVASGRNYPDALAAAPVAANHGVPILLTSENYLPDVTETFIEERGFVQTTVIGGSAVIDEEVEAQLPSPVRISGENRYETAAAIAEQLAVPGNHAYIATGTDFADALTGSVLAAKNETVMLLTSSDRARESVIRYVVNNRIDTSALLGGESALSTEVKVDLAEAHEYVHPLDVLIADAEDGTLLEKTDAYEAPFAQNNYHGDVDAEEPFTFQEGRENARVLITAPHTTRTIRDGNPKSQEFYTGAITLSLQEYTGAHVLYTTKKTQDPNHYDPVPFKEELERVIDQYEIDLVLDIHGAAASWPFAMDIGTNDGELVSAHRPAALMNAYRELGIFNVYENYHFNASAPERIANYSFNQLGVEAMQLKFNRSLRSPDTNLEAYVNGLYGMISYLETEDPAFPWSPADE
ncbi:hypothetical protein CR205_16030 [Alteribacter lacisalsi]|uniref:N-acetylmuramoyl-L-alanine amidase n=1 Tax=Alteribacter lacisalsi TaxID=2045244 RepID=A0A2W0H5I9_9BACI|nr:cell wall-binding repeat-containing protein [Alteribacter lacisalsi]PYZ95886.1 hypothetical protein CR205_16030 [Alteribacter lacisalsi]